MSIRRTTTRVVRVVAVAAAMVVAMAATASARLIDQFPQHAQASRPPTVIRETVIRTVAGPGTIAYVLVAVGVCIALVAAGYLGAHVAMRRIAAQVG
jgi:hypothetical protein